MHIFGLSSSILTVFVFVVIDFAMQMLNSEHYKCSDSICLLCAPVM